MTVSRAVVAGGLVAAVLASGAVRAQQPPYVPKQSDRPTPVEGDEPGFAPIFDGQSLKGWEGDPTYWRVEGGALVGEITPATIVKSNTFIIWRGGQPEGLRAEARLPHHPGRQQRDQLPQRQRARPGDAGQRLRAARLPVRHRRRPKRYVGNNYEEKGRLFMAVRGQVTRVVGGRPPIVVASVGDEAQLAALATDDWNAVHLIVRGNTLMHFLNGRLMSMTIDDDAREPAGRRPDRGAGARRAADEGRVPQHPAEDVVRPRDRAIRYGCCLKASQPRIVSSAKRRAAARARTWLSSNARSCANRRWPRSGSGNVVQKWPASWCPASVASSFNSAWLCTSVAASSR